MWYEGHCRDLTNSIENNLKDIKSNERRWKTNQMAGKYGEE